MTSVSDLTTDYRTILPDSRCCVLLQRWDGWNDYRRFVRAETRRGRGFSIVSSAGGCVRDVVVGVWTLWSGLCLTLTVSEEGAVPLQAKRSDAQDCRRRKFVSGLIRTTREGIQSPRMVAHAGARATDGRNRHTSSLRPMARRLRFPTPASSDRATAQARIGRPQRSTPAPQRLPDGIAKGLADLERKRGRGGDGGALSGAGIAALAGWTRSGREGSEAGDCGGLTTGKRIGDGRDGTLIAASESDLDSEVLLATWAASSRLFILVVSRKSGRPSVSRYG